MKTYKIKKADDNKMLPQLHSLYSEYIKLFRELNAKLGKVIDFAYKAKSLDTDKETRNFFEDFLSATEEDSKRIEKNRGYLKEALKAIDKILEYKKEMVK